MPPTFQRNERRSTDYVQRYIDTPVDAEVRRYILKAFPDAEVEGEIGFVVVGDDGELRDRGPAAAAHGGDQLGC